MHGNNAESVLEQRDVFLQFPFLYNYTNVRTKIPAAKDWFQLEDYYKRS